MVEGNVARWLLNVERGPGGEEVHELNHVGLQSYLTECEGRGKRCGEKEETFALQSDWEDSILRFVGEKCDRVVSYISNSYDGFPFTNTDSPRSK